jgi:hypothetical protein
MEPKLEFMGKSSSAAIVELDELWTRREYDAAFDRCFADDVNSTLFMSVMQKLSLRNYMPKKHIELWLAIDRLVSQMPDRPSKAFLFNQTIIPGNALAESCCTSYDGNLFAYLTVAATKLQEKPNRKGFSKEELKKALQRQDPIGISHLINMVQFAPYKAWSINMLTEAGESLGYSSRLLGIDGEAVYVIDEKVNGLMRLFRLALDGSCNAEILLSARIPGKCYQLNLRDDAFCYFDLDASSIVRASLVEKAKNEVAITVPDNINVNNLHELVASPEGNIIIITVNNRTDEHRQVFGVIKLKTGIGSESATLSESRWFVRKDFPRVRYFANAVTGPSINADGTRCERMAFYFIDVSGNLFTIDDAVLNLPEGGISELDGKDFLKPFELIYTEDNPYAKISVARRIPLIASYEPKSRVVRLWDAVRLTRLLDISTPKKIEIMSFMQDDRLLLTVFRNTNKIEGQIAVTFIDYILLSGKPPIEFDSHDLVRLKPLLAFAPDEVELMVMEQVIKYFAGFNEKHSSSSLGK